MTSLEKLQSVLQGQVSAGGTISVSEATIKEAGIAPAANFDTIIQSYLKLSGTLTLSSKENVPPPSATQLLVSGTASFLEVTAVSVQVTFTLESDNTMNALVVATLPDNWKFSTSFSQMTAFPFNKLSVTTPSYLLTTALQDSYTWNKQVLTLKQGLNYVSYLGMGGPFAPLQNLIGTLTPNDKVIFTGTIDTTQTDDTHPNPAVSLTGTIDKPITGKTNFDLSVPQVQVISMKDDTGYEVYWLCFASTLSINGKPFSIFQAALMENSPNLELSMLPSGKPITPADIIGLIGGVDFTTSIPPVMKDIFDAVGLAGLSVSLNTNSMEVLALNVAIGATQPWPMGQLELKDMVLHCLVFMPFSSGQSVSVAFTATALFYKDIFKGEFHFEISYDVSSKALVIAANFQGQVHLNDLVKGLSNNTVSIPENFGDIEFDDFGVTFMESGGTYDYTLYGSAKGTFPVKVLDSPVVATFEVNIDSAQKSYVLIGGLTIGDSFFQATANLSGSKQVLSGSWQALNNDYLGLDQLLPALGFPNPSIPSDLDLGLKSAAISYNITDQTFVISAESANYGTAVFVAYKDAVTAKWQFYFGLKIDKPINLSNLPLLNKVLSQDERLEIKSMQVILSSVPLDPNKPAEKKEIDLIDSLIQPDYPSIPQQGLTGSIALSAQFDFGGFIIPLSIGTPKKSGGPALLPGSSGAVAGSGSGNSSAPVPAPSQSADGATWFNIQKSFGPVNFQKVGVKYEDGVLWFLVNAALTAAGLEISVVGLAVGSPLSSFEPQFNIQGLGISFSNEVVTISGAFLKLPVKPPVTLEFAGTATIQLKAFGISAVGSYVQFSGQTSMFVFANVNGAFGGPPFFFVTGFCGGFGYNSRLRIPGQNEVYQFPFVSSLSNPGVLGPSPGPTDVLQKIMGGDNPWVSPSAGDIWLAAGIQFTTFQLVNSTALLIAEFGNKFLLALVGISRARFPMVGDMVYAYVELQLEALFDPGEGEILFTAVLSPNSFLLDKNCHLTGGFAMVFWFGPSKYAGDFVLTLGGYSPYYKPPTHYPQEPRLGFNWAIDASISISGGVYFALTPAAVMAGGSLDATYHSGNLKAWFNAHADIIIWYNPFHFIADIGISVGASYKLDMGLCTTTLTVELGADLTLWGPPTGGTATIHWFVISFTVDFGAALTTGIEKQTWDDFQKVLPAPGDVVKIVPLTGLMNGPVAPDKANGSGVRKAMALKDGKDDKPWIVRSDSFQFTTSSSVPLTELYIDGDATPVKTGGALNIKPMQATGLTSKKTLSIISKETGINVLDDTWSIDTVAGSVPNALWGTGSSRELPKDGDLVKGQLSGFMIKVPPPVIGSGTGDISIGNDLQYDPLPPGANPLQLGLDPQGPVPVASDATIADIEQIMSVSGQRDQVFGSFAPLGLGGLENGDLTEFGKKAGAIFVNEPLLTGN
jgi:hypothetical protein